jgi:nicotinamidase-related amidase
MTKEIYPTDTSALVVIDLLNDFLSERGKVHSNIKNELERVRFIPNLKRLLAGARTAGLNDHSFENFKYVHPRLQVAMQNRVFWEGDFGDEFYEPLKPRNGDIIASHHRVFNAFIGTDLDEKLQARGIQKVILAGLTSHTCVEATGRHAIEAGYHLTFLTDAVAEFTEKAHLAALEISYPTFGFEVLTINEFLERIPDGNSTKPTAIKGAM